MATQKPLHHDGGNDCSQPRRCHKTIVKHPHEASKQLVILSAPDGNQKAQLAHLKSKATSFATNLRKQGMLTRNEVWANLTLSIHKTMEYPMSSTCLTKPQWDSIHKTLNGVALPKAGFV